MSAPACARVTGERCENPMCRRELAPTRQVGRLRVERNGQVVAQFVACSPRCVTARLRLEEARRQARAEAATPERVRPWRKQR